jgi:hypothetical protein
MDILIFEKSGATRFKRNLLCLLLATSGVLFLHLQQPLATQTSANPDYRVKATFLFQFTQFVVWAPTAFSTDRTALVIGILGEDPFGMFLDETVRDERSNGRPLIVERYRRLEDLRNCHVLFVSQSEVNRISDILEALKGRSVLLVADAAGFADRGGMIQFVTQGNRIRLRINVAAARAANLTISSNLLRPATIINSGAN